MDDKKKSIIAGIASLIIVIAFIVFLAVLFTRVTSVDNKLSELKADIVSLKEQIKEPNPEFTSSTPYVSIVAENSVGETDLKRCSSFTIRWSGANIVESSCKVAHTNLQDPSGTSLNASFNTIYSSSKEQSMSDCGLIGQQQFTITCEGTDGKSYAHSTAIDFTE
jgi:hypothetical protein